MKHINGFITDQQRIYLPNLANIIQAYKKCQHQSEWKERHAESIEAANNLLPHGSGINGKCEFQPENCTDEKLCIFLEFHHMSENGLYESWTEHNIFITPSLIHGYKMRITGKDKNGIKEYLRDIFSNIFTTDSHE